MSPSIVPPIRILVAYSTVMVCELLSQEFRRRRAFLLAGCAVNLKEVGDVANGKLIDVALVSAHLQDGKGSGLRAVQQLKLLQPKTRAVVIFERSEPGLVVEAFRAGAKGVFSRSEHDFNLLCKCVRAVHAGQVWASGAELEQLVEAFKRSGPVLLTNAQGAKLLSRQESKIVRLVSEGLTNREIATEMGLSGHIVKNYLFKIFDKLGISNRVELALYMLGKEGNAELDLEEVPANGRQKRAG